MSDLSTSLTRSPTLFACHAAKLRAPAPYTREGQAIGSGRLRMRSLSTTVMLLSELVGADLGEYATEEREHFVV